MEKDHGKIWRLTKALNGDYEEKYKSTLLKENYQILTGKLTANKLAETFKENCDPKIPREKSADI